MIRPNLKYMRTPFIMALCIMLSGMNSVIVAQEYNRINDTSSFVDRLEQNSDKTNSIVADFTEKKYMSYLKEPHVSEGKFYYEKEDKLRWEKTQPRSYVLLVNGEKIRISEEGKEQNTGKQERMVTMIKELMLMLVNGEFHKNKAFSPVYKENNENYLIILRPEHRRLKKVYDKIEVIIDKDDMHLNELRFLEVSGDKNVITFKNEKINQKIDDNIFNKL